jgi:hypothetical protein
LSSRFERQRDLSGLTFEGVVAEQSSLGGILRDADVVAAARAGRVRLDCAADEPGVPLVPGLQPLGF